MYSIGSIINLIQFKSVASKKISLLYKCLKLLDEILLHDRTFVAEKLWKRDDNPVRQIVRLPTIKPRFKIIHKAYCQQTIGKLVLTNTVPVLALTVYKYKYSQTAAHVFCWTLIWEVFFFRALTQAFQALQFLWCGAVWSRSRSQPCRSHVRWAFYYACVVKFSIYCYFSITWSFWQCLCYFESNERTESLFSLQYYCQDSCLDILFILNPRNSVSWSFVFASCSI